MGAALETLRRKRVRIILMNLLYFLVLLAAGTLAFFKGAGPAAWAVAALCIAAYLLAARPITCRYTAAVRAAVLEHTVCKGLESFYYSPKQGISPDKIQKSGLLADNSGKAFVSREHITCRKGTMELELADVAFPIVEEGLNSMFNGSFLQIIWPGAEFPSVSVRRGELESLKLPKPQLELAEALGSLIPGSLYLQAAGEELTILLRGRFLGFPINPLVPITEKSLGSNPFPELGQAVGLARLMRLSH